MYDYKWRYVLSEVGKEGGKGGREGKEGKKGLSMGASNERPRPGMRI